jgi:hypothetical protein
VRARRRAVVEVAVDPDVDVVELAERVGLPVAVVVELRGRVLELDAAGGLGRRYG